MNHKHRDKGKKYVNEHPMAPIFLQQHLLLPDDLVNLELDKLKMFDFSDRAKPVLHWYTFEFGLVTGVWLESDRADFAGISLLDAAKELPEHFVDLGFGVETGLEQFPDLDPDISPDVQVDMIAAICDRNIIHNEYPETSTNTLKTVGTKMLDGLST